MDLKLNIIITLYMQREWIVGTSSHLKAKGTPDLMSDQMYCRDAFICCAN